jgi:hypothetical protein
MTILKMSDLWWPFGAHLLHARWGRTFAEVRGWEFFYEENNYPIFHTGRVQDWFESMSTVSFDALTGAEIVELSNLGLAQQDRAEQREWFPKGHHTAFGYHSALMQQLYRPAKHVCDFLAADAFLQKLERKSYIGVHIRRGDKVAGPIAESNAIDLSCYLAACKTLRGNFGLNKVVICSDTSDAFGQFVELASKLDFEVSQAPHYRPPDEWQKADVTVAPQLQRGDLKLREMYLNCFLDMEILRRARVMVADLHSGFAEVARQLRVCGNDVNVRDAAPLYE